jgi:hypothetical protein
MRSKCSRSKGRVAFGNCDGDADGFLVVFDSKQVSQELGSPIDFVIWMSFAA